MKKGLLIIILLLAAMSSCYDGLNGIYDEGRVYCIGDTGPAGGIIALVNEDYESDGWLYLEAAPADEVNADWSSAEALCSSKSLGGYDDWMLPSLHNLMYSNIPSSFLNSDYWSSTEGDAGNAWMLNFGSGISGESGKTSGREVRAVRKF